MLFAVGAVTGTVLSFEFGLLWPRFMDRFGDAFGIAFAIEGIFFFLEAIFIAIYIYGWDRLSPRAHMWAAVPIVISGVGGAFSVIAVNSWMNQPQGFTLDSAGNVTDVKPFEVLFNPAAGYEFFHMLLAAYMVTGFLIASVYAVGMLRGSRDRYHRLGFIIPFTVAAIATPIQLFVGDTAARAIADDQPAKFAGDGVHLQGRTRPDRVPRRDLHRRPGQGRDRDPRARLVPGRVQHEHGRHRPQPDPRGRSAARLDDAAPLLRHDGGDRRTLLLRWAPGSRFVWWRRRDLPATPWFLRAAAVAGVAAVVALECGWIVTEVGRQPWIVNGFMRTSRGGHPRAGDLVSSSRVTMALYIALFTDQPG